MQDYLSLFSRVERRFKDEVRSVDQLSSGDQPDAWDRRLALPMESLAAVLNKDASANPEVSFKLGELALLAIELAGDAPGRRQLAQRLLGLLPEGHTDRVVSRYLAFCREVG